MTYYNTVPSPCYVLEEAELMKNMAVIDRVRREAEVEIIVALKACAMWSIFPTLRQHSDGATASSLAEARLVYEEYGQRAHTYAPVYSEVEWEEIMSYSDYITFNSLGQWNRFAPQAMLRGISCGLRINHEYSTVETDIYNPASPTSRLGVRAETLATLPNGLPEGIEGLHFHSLCESDAEDLVATLEVVEAKFGHLLDRIKWLNMGGGHLMTRKGYNVDLLIGTLKEFKQRHPNLRIILEPGSAFTWRTGTLVATVEDIVEGGGEKTAVMNVSFACHMPDCLEMPYKPAIVGAHDPQEGEERWRIGGNSCLAGDWVGHWAFDKAPQVGDRLVFEDMIHYTMVKTTMFNGVSHPAIAIAHEDGQVEVVRRFGYEDYKNRMG
ncbi:MAG: carboxynorspermidine decarboxylase [Tidjanibacter sp.]|nr:carboxynorspermidine decarboxylase [Tidjanibacter sp.]